jgi:hypothetical protein
VRVARILLLILALAVGQAHACSAFYLCADGAVCSTCSDSPSETQFSDIDVCADAATEPADCQACCELAACATETQSAALALSVQFQQPAAFVEPSLDLPIEPKTRASHGIVGFESQLTHGPPGNVDSRGPPFFRL